jgi:hypothetical protein
VTYRRNPAVVFHQVDDRVMMMNPDRAEFVTLSPTGAAVWYALAEPGSAEDIVERIRPDWPEADPLQMRADIDAFLQNLEAAGAIVRQHTP